MRGSQSEPIIQKIVLIAAIVGLGGALSYALALPRHKPPPSRFSMPSHFTIPILSPFSTVVRGIPSPIFMFSLIFSTGRERNIISQYTPHSRFPRRAIVLGVCHVQTLARTTARYNVMLSMPIDVADYSQPIESSGGPVLSQGLIFTAVRGSYTGGTISSSCQNKWI
jgi:hypothetical protein